MNRAAIARVAILVSAVVLAVVLLASVAYARSSGIFGEYGQWTATLVVVIVAAAGLYVVGAAGVEDAEDAPRAIVKCDECGGVVRADWRLCPHCGVIRGDAAQPRIETTQGVRHV